MVDENKVENASLIVVVVVPDPWTPTSGSPVPHEDLSHSRQDREDRTIHQS
jgi:hypothetical protein